jgi:GNAT superfamily N-acetyltransferase
LLPKDECSPEFEVRKVELPFPELNRFLHRVVGGPWRWGGREDWGGEEWRDYADRDELETWIAYVSGTPAGYYEIEKQEDGSVRITCFGLREEFIGKGYGGCFLTHAVRRCWEIGANRVWLSTCTRDHPNALRNYQARGFQIVSEQEYPD